jgi:molybdopterin-guanine dinucleotide biosynthesis adapter protein
MKVFGIAGFSGSGKTTLIEQIVPLFVKLGLKVSLIKHAHHSFDVDQPGKDSYRHRQAGCSEVLVTSDRRWVLMHELRGEPEPGLAQQLSLLSACDLILVEGFKTAPIPKLEVHRAKADAPLLYPHDSSIVAVATDEQLSTSLPQFDIDASEEIARFIVAYHDLLGASSDRAVAFGSP